ncbi:MAG: GNAT family N-acetyltransferase [Vampirovibrio sp.]|nr:GNAT family N-acetyltransferase [Vampirovibrio sp.]
MITWHIKPFDDLTPLEVQRIHILRNEVFIVEQKCVYQDADKHDETSAHIMAWQESELVATARLMPPGAVCEESSIGRVVTQPSVRGSGVGRELMAKSIEATLALYPNTAIRIGAQHYLQTFYESFGFVPVGETYMEDGILHIQMIFSNAKMQILSPDFSVDRMS